MIPPSIGPLNSLLETAFAAQSLRLSLESNFDSGLAAPDFFFRDEIAFYPDQPEGGYGGGFINFAPQFPISTFVTLESLNTKYRAALELAWQAIAIAVEQSRLLPFRTCRLTEYTLTDHRGNDPEGARRRLDLTMIFNTARIST